MTRKPLPPRREGESIDITHTWNPLTDRERHEFCRALINRHPVTDEIVEVFINYETGLGRGSVQEQMGWDVGVLISLALQHGVPLQTLRDATKRDPVNFMGKMRMMPATIIGAVLDAIAQEAGLPPSEVPEDPLAQPGDGSN